MKIEDLSKEQPTPALCKGAVISRFLYDLAEEYGIAVDNILIGIELPNQIRDDGKVYIELLNLDLVLIDRTLSENGL